MAIVFICEMPPLRYLQFLLRAGWFGSVGRPRGDWAAVGGVRARARGLDPPLRLCAGQHSWRFAGLGGFKGLDEVDELVLGLSLEQPVGIAPVETQFAGVEGLVF